MSLIQITIMYDNIMMVVSNRSHLWPDHDDRANEWALGKEELPCPVDISSLRHSPVQPHLVSTYCPDVHPTVCALHSRVQLVHCTLYIRSNPSRVCNNIHSYSTPGLCHEHFELCLHCAICTIGIEA